MKTLSNLFPLALCIGIIASIPFQQVRAQSYEDTTNIISGDTMYVAWMQTGSTPRTNALRSAIYGDTASDGSRANLDRVYVLKADGFYWLCDAIVNTGFPLRLIGESPTADGMHAPALLQLTDVRPDGTPADTRMITGENDVTMKNIFVSGCTTGDGIQTANQPITITANNCTFVIDSCIFQRSNFALMAWTGPGNDITIRNCKFRNLLELPPTQQGTGRGISFWSDQESIVIENNTFFNIGSTVFQMENGSSQYVLFNHNTIVNVGRGIMSPNSNGWRQVYCANNLIINGWWEGEGYADMHTGDRDPRLNYNGLFQVGALAPSYGPPQSRRVVITNTAAYLDPIITAKYGSGGVDTIVRAWMLDSVSKEDYIVPLTYDPLNLNTGHMYVGDTTWLDHIPTGMPLYYLTDPDWRAPQFTDETGATMIDSMWAFITQVRNGPEPYTIHFYKPAVLNSSRIWPLPENFSYTDASLITAGIDGLPLGDLNWFPAQKAAYYTDRFEYVAAILHLVGWDPDPVFYNYEAEDGGVSGTAAIITIEGFIYWNYNQVGTLTWTFNVPADKAGIYNTKWLVNLDNQTESQGMILHIDGQQINDKIYGWGATPFAHDEDIGAGPGPTTGLDYGWVWIELDTINCQPASAFTLTEGTHTIGVRGGGWNRLLFAEIDLAPMTGSTGDDTIKCKGAYAEAVGVIAWGDADIPWTPSKFKYVAMGAAGVDTITIAPYTRGTYKLFINGQNISGSSKLITISSEAGTTLGTAVLPYEADSTGSYVMSSAVSLSAGTQKIILSGADVNIDYFQLVEVTVGVDDGGGIWPADFALQQNYPNPFNPATRIEFTLAKPSNVKLIVYNILGQNVATLIDGRLDPGPQSVMFNASALSSGVYFYRLEAGSFTAVKKMLVMK